MTYSLDCVPSCTSHLQIFDMLTLLLRSAEEAQGGAHSLAVVEDHGCESSGMVYFLGVQLAEQSNSRNRSSFLKCVVFQCFHEWVKLHIHEVKCLVKSIS